MDMIDIILWYSDIGSELVVILLFRMHIDTTELKVTRLYRDECVFLPDHGYITHILHPKVQLQPMIQLLVIVKTICISIPNDFIISARKKNYMIPMILFTLLMFETQLVIPIT